MLARVTWWPWAICIVLIAGCGIKKPVNSTSPNPAPMVVTTTRPSQSAVFKEAPANAEAVKLFELGIQQYDQGQYRKTTLTLQQAIDTGLPPDKRIIAHKHLAFIYCISSRETLCRNEFTKALVIDPKFELTAAEIGHPQWGPVFRSTKAGR